MRRLGCSAGFMVVNRAGRLRPGLLAEDCGWGGATKAALRARRCAGLRSGQALLLLAGAAGTVV